MKRLQDFSFDKSRYERPCQKKICGWSVFGKACQIGPGRDGHCQAQYECVPYRKGDRWLCTRPVSSGGKCEAGPDAQGICCNKIPRCVPIDNLRQRRGRLVKWVVMFFVVLLVSLMTTPWRSQMIDPGELTAAHQLGGGACKQCHQLDGTDRLRWFVAAFEDRTVHQVNRKCESCHDLGYHSASPHSLAPEKLRTLTKSAQPSAVFSLAVFSPEGVNGAVAGESELACVSCHREHQGRAFDITAIDNAQCANCHQSRHRDFASSHPDFGRYPYRRRQRIIFDHAAHIKDYFNKDRLKIFAPATCMGCHELNDDGRYMQVGTFENGCRSCHGKDVTGEKLEQKGFAVFSLPALDIAALSEAGLAIGEWPADMEDEEMSGMMLFLLSTDERLRPILRKIAAGEVELSDLSGQPETVLRDVQSLAWATKRLLDEWYRQGTRALLQRLRKAAGITGDRLDAGMAGKLPIDLVAQRRQAWFPGLAREMARLAAGQFSKTRRVSVGDNRYDPDLAAEDWVSAGGWYAQDFSLYYRPGGHADELLRRWLEMTLPDGNDSPAKKAAFEQLSDTKIPGQCTKCHSLDREDKRITVNWRGFRAQPAESTFTTFNHRAHFSLLDDKGCLHCHRLNPEADYLAGYDDFSSQTFRSSWHDLDKKVCAGCHHSQAAGEQCTQCHNYHVGRFEAVMPAGSSPGRSMTESVGSR